MESNNQYCILWNTYHSDLTDTLSHLQQRSELTDVTLATADGNSIEAHQLVVTVCSSFLGNFIKNNSSKNSIILLPTEIKFGELKAMVEFMYTGQVCLPQNRLQAFIKGARYLRIKGLENQNDNQCDEEISEGEIGKHNFESKRKKIRFSKEEDENDAIPTTTIKGKTVKDHRYTQQVDLGDSDDNRDKWEEVDRKPVIFPRTKRTLVGDRKRRRHTSSLSGSAMSLSADVVCYDVSKDLRSSAVKVEPINKVRRHILFNEDDMEICTCAARKIWSVKDTEALLNAWMDTLNQVPPSYFIRSMSLCRSVAKRLQQLGVQKNWKQCQVKMKNLRREVRLYKESAASGVVGSARKASEVANACQQLLSSIEGIFNKEEAIRQQWYERKGVSNERNEAEDDTGDLVTVLEEDGIESFSVADLEDEEGQEETRRGPVVHHIVEEAMAK